MGPRGNALLRINFDHDWETQKGKVFDWYRSQPVTQFKSIQYRKDRQEPFCHEFIVLKLNDGTICRFERMGDPDTRTAALARRGTTAHDFAQVWPKEQLAKLDESSDVIAEIEYPQEFDILDILALCYAIHQDPEAKQYTLQRYNCYFLSWSIMTYLARKASQWDQLFTESAWSDAMGVAAENMTEMARAHNPELYPHELAFRVTRLLSEDAEAPSKFLLDAVRAELEKDETRREVSEALTKLVWQKDVNAEMKKGLNTAIKAAAEETSRHPTVGRIILEEPCSEEKLRSARQIMDMQELRLVEEQWSSRYHRNWREEAQVALDEYEAEQDVGLLKGVGRTMKLAGLKFAGAANGAKGSFLACISEGPDTYKRIKNDWLRRRAINLDSRVRKVETKVYMAWAMTKFTARVVAVYARTGAIGARVAFMNTDVGGEFPLAPDWIDMTDASISGALNVAGRAGQDDPEFVRACVLRNLDGKTDFTLRRSTEDEETANMCKRWDKTWQTWVMDSVGTPLAELLAKRMNEIEPESLKLSLIVSIYSLELFLAFR